ncbi:MAG TPA: photosynthetic complex assembly protein PuhC [Longimicrobiaceae bacterium]|jgi:putative photosynthetic complex assembly protein
MMIEFEEEPQAMRVPRPMLLAAAALIALAVALALTARVSDAGATRIAAPAAAQTRAARDLRFADRADGGIVVTDAATGAVAGVVEPGSNTFVRGAMRGLAFERRKRGVGPEAPVRLARWRDGRLTLEDPATGVVLDLAAYGPDNREAFARLLPAGS